MEVIEQKVIVAEVAMIQNCWINELSVEFLETNFAALDTRQPYPPNGVRNFFRIHDEIHEHVTQVLSETEVEEYKTPSASGEEVVGAGGARALEKDYIQKEFHILTVWSQTILECKE